MEKRNTVWVIRAGREGEGHNLFLSGGCAGFREPRLGDMRELRPDRAAFVEAYKQAYPEKTARAWANWGREAFSLVHGMSVGDLIVYPPKYRPKPHLDKNVHVGRVTTGYKYDASAELQFCHLRRVTWLHSFPRKQVSAGAQEQLNRRPALYEVSDRYAGEFAAIVGGAVAGVHQEG